MRGQASEYRHLGGVVDDQLKWQAHIKCVTNAVAKKKNVYTYVFCLVSDTFLVLKRAEHSAMRVLCLE